MKRYVLFAALFASFATLSAAPAFARDTVNYYPLDQALHSEPGKVSDDVALYFAGQHHPAVVKTMGEFDQQEDQRVRQERFAGLSARFPLGGDRIAGTCAQGRRQCGDQHQEQLQERIA